MCEVLVLIVLVGMIGDMARRRGRRPDAYALLLVGCWIGGALTAGLMGFGVAKLLTPSWPALLVAYGFAAVGSTVSAAAVFLLLHLLGPIDDVWREQMRSPVPRSRFAGAMIGGVAFGAIGAAVGAFLHLGPELAGRVLAGAQGFLIAAIFGAWFGMLAGYQKM
jgi:MFS family permease